jgi:hypothetical protein
MPNELNLGVYAGKVSPCEREFASPVTIDRGKPQANKIMVV